MKPVRLVFAATLAVVLAGCVNLDLPGFRGAAPIMYHVLDDAGRTAPAAASPAAKTLILVDTQTSPFYDNDGIAFSKQQGTRGYYQYAKWTERPGKRFTALLIARLEKERIFAAVAQTGTNVHGDWLLTTELVELYHEAGKEPGSVRLVLRAELSDLNKRTLVSRKFITQSVPAASYDAEGAHQAFNQAVTQAMNELADWLRALSKAG